MSFKLEVQFTGLCLHVQHRDDENGTRPEVAVLLPDARFRGDAKRHPDRTPAVPHVGYLRLDLANVVPELAATSFPPDERPRDARDMPDGPHFEVVYRLGDMADRLTGGQTLDFGLPDDAYAKSMTVDTKLPSFDDIAPAHKVRADLFTKLGGANVAEDTPSPLLLRTLLRGGKLVPSEDGVSLDLWSIDPFLRGVPGGAPQDPIVGCFPGAVTWTRDVDASSLTLTFRKFDGTVTARLPLQPRNGEIKLKIANLCADNPLEWNELELRTAAIEDSDFKWFYQLLDPTATSWKQFLEQRALNAVTVAGGAKGDPPPIVPRQLPAPRLVTQPTEGRITDLGVQNCAPSTASRAFAPYSEWEA